MIIGKNSRVRSHSFICSLVTIGSNATILPINICSDVVIGAGSVITKDITSSGIYAGNPAKKIGISK